MSKMTDSEIESKRVRLNFEIEMESIKWRVRRRVCISSFIINTLLGLLYFVIPLILNESQLSSLKEFNSIIITLIGSNSSIILMYYGSVTYSDTMKLPTDNYQIPSIQQDTKNE